MKRKIVTLALGSILLFGCGSSKPVSDDCCKPTVTENHHERQLNGMLFGLVTYILFSIVTAK